MEIIHLIIVSGLLAVIYGVITSISVLSADTGNEKMQEIAKAIQEGASAYLSRQYSTISIVGLVILIISYFLLGLQVSIGFLIGSVMSGLAGYIGMLVSVRANVRTTHASSVSLANGLSIAFKSGAVTGMLVAGL
ncbi:MAG: sodium/proton-translocating pyrophosphatase, partial [Pseudomonadota bacterium]|nr:sodium/proton-translocating pyrophosphatase [Pseudomonadota bacterium]